MALKSSSTIASKNIVYSSFSYKGRSTDGSCDLWQVYVTGSLAIPTDQFYFSSAAISIAYYSPPSVLSYNMTVSCSSASSVSALLSALQRQMSSSTSLNLQVSCDGTNVQVFLCNGGVSLCVDCDWACACPPSPILSPCMGGSSCYGNHASFAVLRFTYSQLAVAPKLEIIRIVPSRLAVQVTVNMSTEGGLYGYAASPSTDVTSVLTVRQSGTYMLVGSKYVLTTLTLLNLSPATTYSLYLYAETFAGVGMSIDAVRALMTSVTTLCCADLVFTTTYPKLLQYIPTTATTVDADVFVVTLDASPPNSVRVNVSARAVPCSGSSAIANSSTAVAIPSSFVYEKGAQLLSSSFVLHGTVGCYSLTAFTASGYFYNNATTSVETFSNTAAFGDPAISSVVFSDDGAMLYVYFDSPTNYGAGIVTSYTSSFQCSLVLSFVGASYATCTWQSNRLLVATINGAYAGPTIGDTVTLIASVIHPAVVLSKATSAATSAIAVVQAPRSPSLPAAALSTAKTIGSCDNILLDPTASTGSGGRPWKSVVWYVSGTGSSANSAPTLTSFLNTHYNSTTALITIPSASFKPGGSLTFFLFLENFLGASSAAMKTVTILANATIPTVKITGSGQVSTFRNEILRLFASASVSACANTTSLILTYSWRVYENAKLLTNLVSTSLNDRIFLLPAYSLDVLTKYTVQVTVTDPSGDFNSDYTYVIVGRSGVLATIAGGSHRKVSTASVFTLDASGSYDLDYPTASNLNYTWTCFIVSPTYGSPCSLSLNRAAKLTFSPGKLVADVTYNFTVIVTSSDGYTSFSSVAVKVVSQPLPNVIFGPIAKKYNVDDRIIVKAVINATSSFTASWSCPSCGFNLSSIVSSPLSVAFSAGVVSVSLAIMPSTLTVGLTYSFQIAAGYAASPTVSGSASVGILVNGPPYGGTLSVTPSKGYVLTTSYVLNTYGWYDDPSDYPLQYSMSYFSLSPATALTVQSLSQLQYTSAYLGQGLESTGYKVTCVAEATDTYGAAATTSTDVIVLPTKSVTSLQPIISKELDAALTTLNSDRSSSVINAAALSLNSVNCSSAPNCALLNRIACSTQAHTCGVCLDEFIGVSGQANSACKSPADLRLTGASCSFDTDCASQKCSKGKCSLAGKLCPANCTSHGECVYTDSNGHSIDFCDVNSLFCQAKCSCHQDWFGSDCSLGKAELKQRTSLRDLLCFSYYSSTLVQVTDTH